MSPRERFSKGTCPSLGGRIHAAPGAQLRGEKNELSVVQVNGKDPVQLFMNHLFSGKGFTHCELRVLGG